MGHCIHGKQGICVKAGVECYQNGLTASNANMSVEDFEKIEKECNGIMSDTFRAPSCRIMFYLLLQ